MSKVHFVGVCGSGMSALAQFHAMGGGIATGSDRLSNKGEAAETLAALRALGVNVLPQDGGGVGADTERVVISTAIEDGNADLEKARRLGRPVAHRADELAAHVAAMRALAVAGTSGKSTVTAMVFDILESSGRAPSVITGAALASLRGRGLLGNAFRGRSDLLVIEADESDGTLPKYRPWLGLLLNMSKDHKELSELRVLFQEFRSRCRSFVVNADAENLAEFREGSETFGFLGGTLRGENLELGPAAAAFSARGVRFSIPMPGAHNAHNALAAASACLQAGVPLEDSARALAVFQGVSRRFERVGAARGVEIIDDYAHNPDKVRAAIAAAKLRGRRILAVFQPHGFGPTRFLKDDFIKAFSEALGPEDALWLPDIYYAGGTAVKDISSKDIVEPVARSGRRAFHVPRREDIAGEIAREARPGDLVLVMGARDLSLSAFARGILQALDR